MSRRYSLFAAFAVMACVARSVGLAFVERVDQLVRFILSAVSPQPPLVLAGQAQGFGGHAHTFADPMVDRHEAGLSRRAAARNI